MTKRTIFLLFAIVFGLAFVLGPQKVSAQDKPAAEKKEKAAKCDDDDDDDEEITEADRATVKISIKDAKIIAIGRVPGKIMDAEFEKEHGRLQYAFDILGEDGKTYDVEIDALTGEVLQADIDDDDDDDVPAATNVVKTKRVDGTLKVDRSAKAAKKP
jgi:uncharacterized membrane protein YkoI